MREANDTKPLQATNNEKTCVEVPSWLTTMYDTVYFDMCIAHPDTKLDHFCIDCVRSLCHNCLVDHALHKYVKIRRYVYCEVINRRDLCKLFNCSGIQAYHTNKTKVIFLKQRPQQQTQQPNQQHNSREHSCIVCKRSLQDASLYCSIACKVSFTFRGDEHKEETKQEHNNPSDEKEEGLVCEKCRDQEEEEDIKLSSLKRPKVRKGVALRAPMF